MTHQESLRRDAQLEAELDDLIEEKGTLGPLDMQRKVAIKERCEAIARERLELFKGRMSKPVEIDRSVGHGFEDLYTDASGRCYTDADEGL